MRLRPRGDRSRRRPHGQARADAGTGRDTLRAVSDPRRRDTLRAVSDPTASDPVLTGGCLCGGIRFELTAPAAAAGYCHCTRCQRRTGTGASLQARIDGRTFRLVRARSWSRPGGTPMGASRSVSAAMRRSPLQPQPRRSHADERAHGRFDADPSVRPSWRAFVAYAAAWEPVPDDGLERFPEGKPYG